MGKKKKKKVTMMRMKNPKTQ